MGKLTKLLKPSDEAAQRDKATFTRWEEKTFTTAQVINLFKKSNEIDEDERITNGEMEDYMNSLGYRRK